MSEETNVLLKELDQLRRRLSEAVSFDHRGSIVDYLEAQATALSANGRSSEATLIRAQATNIKNQLDLEPGKKGIASPVDAVIYECCGLFGNGGIDIHDVIAEKHSRDAELLRVRFASVWVAKKRLNWTNEQLSDHFDRDPSTIRAALTKAEELRSADAEFRSVTDDLTKREIRCENCQHPLLHLCPMA